MRQIALSSTTTIPRVFNLHLCSTQPFSRLKLPAVQGNIDPEAKATRHSRYYFKAGNIVFLIELYNDHRYFFERDSTHFRSILESVQGANECNPIAFDFCRPAEKISTLHLAAKWGFNSIQLLAIDSLTTTAILVDKIVLGRRYGISDWLPGAYKADIIRISATMQVYEFANARYETRHLSNDLGDIFRLEKPVEEVGVGSTDVEESAIKILED
ncbi:hypothetical protein FIBSPDRAFT_1055074 [Athelia psychrophila]|uniref:BTB domain-containing protein n=1 Tax=Athelia psychrophila TaxID=1759441 RepID=A0A167UCH9_9AGAM|nr:hypothetical protein FIBSPDRAFT_1055074 [Fibularhizoctonia sp. CBS 109695]